MSRTGGGGGASEAGESILGRGALLAWVAVWMLGACDGGGSDGGGGGAGAAGGASGGGGGSGGGPGGGGPGGGGGGPGGGGPGGGGPGGGGPGGGGPGGGGPGDGGPGGGGPGGGGDGPCGLGAADNAGQACTMNAECGTGGSCLRTARDADATCHVLCLPESCTMHCAENEDCVGITDSDTGEPRRTEDGRLLGGCLARRDGTAGAYDACGDAAACLEGLVCLEFRGSDDQTCAPPCDDAGNCNEFSGFEARCLFVLGDGMEPTHCGIPCADTATSSDCPAGLTCRAGDQTAFCAR